MANYVGIFSQKPASFMKAGIYYSYFGAPSLDGIEETRKLFEFGGRLKITLHRIWMMRRDPKGFLDDWNTICKYCDRLNDGEISVKELPSQLYPLAVYDGRFVNSL